jgi:cold shock CspA family protein
MNNQTIYTGIVVFYNREKHFGFIDSQQHERLFFKHIGSKEAKELRKQKGLNEKGFLKGDEVQYKVRYAKKPDAEIEAYDVVFIDNEKAAWLKKNIEDGATLWGYLKKIKDQFYVKEHHTYFFFRVHQSCWEIPEHYELEQRENEGVTFTIDHPKARISKMKAILLDRRMQPVYYTLKEWQEQKIPVEAMVTGVSKAGYFMQIIKTKTQAFMLQQTKKEILAPANLLKGEKVLVTIKHVLDTGIIVVFHERIQVINEKIFIID